MIELQSNPLGIPQLSLTVNKFGWASDMPDRDWEPTIFVYVKLGKRWYPLDAQTDGSDVSLCLSGVGLMEAEEFIHDMSKLAVNEGFLFILDDDFWYELADALEVDDPDHDPVFDGLRKQFEIKPREGSMLAEEAK
jgi:hypothetical protein